MLAAPARQTMTSTKPYLLRAIYDWCVDQGFTPYLQVVVDAATRVPREHVKDGQIVLNVGPDATHQMSLGNEEISFQARFNGQAFPVRVPMGAVMAIYARENGQGLAFEPEAAPAPGEHVSGAMPDGSAVEQPADPGPESSPPGRPRLTRVK